MDTYSGIAGSSGMSILTFTRVFPNSSSNWLSQLYSHPQFLLLHILANFLYCPTFHFLLFGQYLIIVLIYISMITSEFEYLLMCYWPLQCYMEFYLPFKELVSHSSKCRCSFKYSFIQEAFIACLLFASHCNRR